MGRGDLWQKMRCLERESLGDLHRVNLQVAQMRNIASAFRASRSACGSAGSAASADAPGNRRRRLRVGGLRRAVHRLQEEVPEGKPCELSGSSPSCGKTSFSSSPGRATSGAPALGLTQIQSSPSGGASVPLVSTATRKPRACRARRSAAASSCSSGSPPVNTTSAGAALAPPLRRDGTGQLLRAREFAAARAVGADEIRVAEIAHLPRRGPPRGPTRDCSRRSGRRRRRARPARLRLAACGRSP